MSLVPSIVATLIPSQFFVFTLSNPLTHDCYLRGPLLRIAVLDSPKPPSGNDVPTVAAMIVPAHRESDWIFSTESGQSHLLHSNPDVSRLVLIGNLPPGDFVSSIYVRPPANLAARREKEKLEMELGPLLIALHPQVCFGIGMLEPRFLTYEDTVVFRVTICTGTGPIVGEFLVEDVEVETEHGGRKDFRRRLRFKRMPNLIQSEVRLIPSLVTDGWMNDLNLDLFSLKKMNDVKFEVDPRVLIPTYLNAMVSGIFLIVTPLDRRAQLEIVPRALCLGVGGGSLLHFLNAQLGFHVVGVESDGLLLDVAQPRFGLRVGDRMNIFHEDAAGLLEVVSCGLSQQRTDGLAGCLRSKFDVVMVDLDASDARFGNVCPPTNFFTKPVLLAAKLVLHDHGVFVMNVVVVNDEIYSALVLELKTVFYKVFQMVVRDQENYILVATLSPLARHEPCTAFSIRMRLREAVSREYIGSIKEV
ncbi:hypothetical protein OSB04_026816 [Centaurea solstitialis]|uniref:Methyltransferase-like protein 13 n=1 Tax=Centaurea solstitialis TaxID=347529 RepID=A0AA38SQ48_9ASTR|nr:hypothetical protein OSB04_026816 [Centaurea solstitialis]